MREQELRKIIEERLENARNDFHNSLDENGLEEEENLSKLYTLQGQCHAYQDCLNLFPTPRTEQEILKEFEELGYTIYDNPGNSLLVLTNCITEIRFFKVKKKYVKCNPIRTKDEYVDMQELKLIHELCSIWGWI